MLETWLRTVLRLFISSWAMVALPLPGTNSSTSPQLAQRRIRGRHAGAAAHQQRVAAEQAQPLELGAHGRLAQPQADGGARDAAFSDHGVEDADE